MANTDLLVHGLVSVIIPMYNSEVYIKSTIESVLAQTYQNFEIIIVDDCSQDRSCEIVESFNDSRIILIRLLKNQGVAIARNEAMKSARGQFIAFLDSDDIWLPNKLEKQLNFMKKGIFFSYTALGIIDDKGKMLKEHITVPNKCNYSILQKNTLIATSTVILDRLVLGNIIMPNLRSGQDYATWMKILSKGNEAYGINHPLVIYRKRNNSLSSNKLKSIIQVWYIQTKIQNIEAPIAFFNILCFCYNAFKKHI